MTARTDEYATATFADIGVVNFWIVAVLAIIGAFTRAARRAPWALWTVPLLLWPASRP